MQNGPSFFFAGGGTGGHIYPALAVAEELQTLAPDSPIHFLCSTRPIDSQILSNTPFPFTTLKAQGLSRNPRTVLRFAKTFQQSARETRALLSASPNPVIIGAGGFVAGPVCWTARRMKIPIVLINVDIVAGKANKLAARWAQDIFLQFEEATPAFARYRANLHTVGCPLRQNFQNPNPQQAIEDLQLDPKKKILLVTGASSGAQRINEAVIALLDRLSQFADAWQIVHLTGHRNYDEVLAAYQATSPPPYHVIVYYDHMADLLAAADLLIGRSGAVSVAEYAIAGIPAICMPYPFHSDRHQYRNATKLVEAGAAVIVDDVPNVQDRSEWLWDELESILNNTEKRQSMSQAAQTLARPEAAKQIATHLIRTYSPKL